MSLFQNVIAMLLASSLIANYLNQLACSLYSAAAQGSDTDLSVEKT